MKYRIAGSKQLHSKPHLEFLGFTDIDFWISVGVIIPVEEEKPEFIEIMIDPSLSYIVSIKVLEANPYKPFSETFHSYNLGFPVAKADYWVSKIRSYSEKKSTQTSERKIFSEEVLKQEKKQTPADQKKFSLNDIRALLKKAPTNNQSPIFRSLENDVVEMALMELI